MICKCPAAATLPDIPVAKCPESFGQIQKIAFQRLTSASGAKNSFTSTNAIIALASWTKNTAASDDTKIVISPYIEAPTTEPGDAITFGGGNDTRGGRTYNLGRNPTTFNGVIRQVPQNVIKALKELQCESEGDNLGIYLFDQNGAIGAIQDPATEGTYYPIPISSLFVGDKTLGGLDSPDSNTISWQFLPNWSDDLKIVEPEFNPLTDL